MAITHEAARRVTKAEAIPVVFGPTFVMPWTEGKGYVVYAWIAGTWQSYTSADDIDSALRLARKVAGRLQRVSA